MPGIPQLTHLQFLVVGILRGQQTSGRRIRRGLEEFEVRKSGPAFYQLMARMEDSGLVEGSYHQEIVEGQIIRERFYVITAEGAHAWSQSRDFYLQAIRGLDGLEGLAGA